MAEVSVESEYFNNPTQEQIEYLENARDNSANDTSGSDSITLEENHTSSPQTSASSSGLLGTSTPEDEKNISYTGKDGEEFHYSVREWEDDWNKRDVDNQWQNLGRSPEDMYDRESYLDRNGKSAWEEKSSLGVPKAVWLEELYKTDDKGNFIHQEQIDAVKEARQRSRENNRDLEDKAFIRDNRQEADNLRDSNELKLDVDSLKTNVDKSRDRREEYNIFRGTSGDPGSGVRGMLDDSARNAPMYAQAGVSTNGPKYDAKSDKNLSDLIDKSLNQKTGTFSKVGQKIMEGANALTLGIAPKTNDITNLDKDAYRNAVIEYKQSNPNISNQDAVKYISDLAEKSSLGLAKEGIEYYIRTGDTLGNKHAANFENKVTELTNAFVNGKISEEEYSKQIDQLSNVSNTQQFLSLLTSPSVSGVAGLAAGAAVGAGVAKIAEKPLAFAAQKLAEMSGKVGPKGLSHPFAAKIMDSIYQSNKGKISSELFDRAMKNNSPYRDLRLESAITSKPGTVGALRQGVKATTEGLVTPATVAATAATEAAKENIGKVAPATAAAIPSQKAEAAPTGIYDESGKMIDSREIVAERKDKPYEGEDKVTLQSREGEVTVSPREAVIIGESEGLTPERGYTDEVKAAAKGSEVYEKPEVEKVETLPDKQISTFQRCVDVIQAILGGRDINLDRTISAREWYDSTLGKAVDRISNIFSFSGKDNIDKVGEKGVWDKVKDAAKEVGNKISNTIDNIGSSLKGVVDLKNGNVYVIEDALPSKAETKTETKTEKTDKADEATDRNILQRGLDSAKEWINGVIPDKEELVGVIKNTVSNVLPGWSDEASRDLATEAVLHVGDLSSYGPIQLAKGVGAYVTDTADEIYWLTTGNRMSNDDKAALNFVITNMVGLPLAPASTIARDITEGIGSSNRSAIEEVLSGETSNYILPYTEENRSANNEEDFAEKKKRSIDELEEVTSEGNKQESLSGINLPALSEDDLDWLIRRPEMKNYDYR